jgi:tRNA(Ile)-lysidine synthase
MDEFIHYWFSRGPSLWFSASPADDGYLATHFAPLLDLPERPPDRVGPAALGWILAWDQLPRHVWRGDAGAAHVVAWYLQKALVLSDLWMATPDALSELSDHAWMFVLLPQRHTGNPWRVRVVMELAWARIGSRGSLGNLRSFVRATYDRAPIHHGPFSEVILPSALPPAWDIGPHIDILEYGPAELSGQAQPLPSAFTEALRSVFCDAPVTFTPLQPLIVSLSGGVDSMMLARAALLVFGPERLVAVHINYANRGVESDEEEAFVRAWCAHTGLKLVVRRIDEIHRPTCVRYELREIYERYTRDVRYGVYRAAAGEGGLPWVLLGHHLDDGFENAMANIAMKQKYENITGMGPTVELSGIVFVRPWLVFSKSQILEIARRTRTPFTRDSTQAQCQRGQIRDTVRTALESWNADFVPGIFALAHHLQEADVLIEQYTDRLSASIGTEWAAHEVPWSAPTVWRRLFQKHSGARPSLRATRHFVERLRRWRTRPRKVSVAVSRACHVILHPATSPPGGLRIEIHSSG